MLRIVFVVLSGLLAPWGQAQVCPASGAGLARVGNAIDDFIRNGRAPAGADCAYSWARGYNFGDASLTDEELRFIRTAADVQRTAAMLRRDSGNQTTADTYLKHEIELRQAFIAAATARDDAAEVARLRSPVVQHLSYLTAAMALRNQYETVTQTLGEQDPTYVDKEAVKVWLQALWSCASWDGQKTNLCVQEKKTMCRDKITVFLDAWNSMGQRALGPQARSDINALHKLTAQGGCLQ